MRQKVAENPEVIPKLQTLLEAGVEISNIIPFL
jgi:hypothetical protein